MKMNQQIKTLRQQAGYTLIELAITVAIISVLVMSALFGVQKILENNNADTTAQQVTLATANVNKYTTMLSDSSFLDSLGGAAALGVWPENIVTKGGSSPNFTYTVKNPFGGTYLIGKTAAGASFYNVGIIGLSNNACVAVAAALANAALTVGVDEVVTYTGTPTLAPTTAVANIKFSGGKATGASLTAACTSSALRKNIWLTYAL